ncbi:hypothetical protein GOBAR_AA30621 [Gossypium barbadense]|uniref:Uncharacterized protein n=1 Tax=Gossypium barbadense TaxID=3634 RepID=A0A2P5WG46_GOSBA|nr:hypothetical protein GOBAR_AA30621 [Gossypium barbadense]
MVLDSFENVNPYILPTLADYWCTKSTTFGENSKIVIQMRDLICNQYVEPLEDEEGSHGKVGNNGRMDTERRWKIRESTILSLVGIMGICQLEGRIEKVWNWVVKKLGIKPLEDEEGSHGKVSIETSKDSGKQSNLSANWFQLKNVVKKKISTQGRGRLRKSKELKLSEVPILEKDFCDSEGCGVWPETDI